MRIAALDDEPTQLELIRLTMEGLGHECHGFAEGKALLRALRQETFDLLILDWSLPDMAGPAVVRTIREELLNRIPILFVTNRREVADMVEALGVGADDFMPKPIRVGELSARTQALLRRAYPALHETEVVFGPYHFFPHSRTLHVNGEPLELKHREYELALFLFQNMGRLLSREHLREAVWGQGPEAPSRSLDTHISRLRTKLDLRPNNGFLLSAIYGLGYRLEAIDGDALNSRPDALSTSP
ncbi:MAG: response regulator transcription factor [Rhodocyclaceae bacterium]|nr:response regulator transcription factor [Pseudomonadota bacterium]MDQ7972040.1 response regulator transcription factor [Rhodocyclaceae bacterium]MDQ8000276.1 response regulator transcription factor [Pseudomonadota bacterium]MDQ8018198.1 response regulator transcription factor [Pseudomonadota bacterium]